MKKNMVSVVVLLGVSACTGLSACSSPHESPVSMPASAVVTSPPATAPAAEKISSTEQNFVSSVLPLNLNLDQQTLVQIGRFACESNPHNHDFVKAYVQAGLGQAAGNDSTKSSELADQFIALAGEKLCSNHSG